MSLDRVKEPLARLVRNAVPGVDYLTTYRARVIVQRLEVDNSMTVDVVPDDSRLPPMSRVRWKLGVPGASAQISPGAFVHVGWENGDPRKAYAVAVDGGEADPLKILLRGLQVILGDEATAQPLILGLAKNAIETTIWGAISGAAGLAATANTTAATTPTLPNLGAAAAANATFYGAIAGFITTYLLALPSTLALRTRGA